MINDDPDAKRARIVEARLKLRDRINAETSASPSLSDPAPLGSGPPNRHGMPRVPIEQVETKKWPVLDLGAKPDVSHARWRLVVDGACRRPLELDWAAFHALEQVDDVSDFHCVTTWSRLDLRWRGVQLAELIAHAEPDEEAHFVMLHAYDKYTTNLPLAEAIKPDVLLVHTVDGKPLPREHGGPVRVITPQLYAWKGAKWVNRVELMKVDRRGFWEARGYSNTAYPWRNDRYA
jgi:DMSO/TMAO reductase YedYZ molybdopterin-dependent catalytic subunit